MTGSKNIQGSNGSGTFSVAGGQANGVNYLLDGGDNNDSFSNVNLPIPFPDAVQEFSVQTNAMQAQFGLHPGGVVNVVTKSGTNAFHGDLFEFFRNYELNARPKGLVLAVGFRLAAGARFPEAQSIRRHGGRQDHSRQAILLRRISTDRAAQQPREQHGARADGFDGTGNFSVEDAATSAGGCQSKAITLKDPANGQSVPRTTLFPSTVSIRRRQSC